MSVITHLPRAILRLLPLLLLLLQATPPARADTGNLGETDFATSGSPEAHEHFMEGLLALHSFEYRDARDAFLRAQEIEPGFAMAYWGEAMTYNHPLWLEEDLPAARAALARLAPTPAERQAKAPTKREKGYLKAVDILFGEGEKLKRDLAYAEAMRQLQKSYPDDLDAASFHALALLGTCHDGRDTATYMRAAAIVEEVFAKNPRHPGAAHYLIHSYDDPVHAPLGLRPARVYAEIAPAAEHALHMPAHIFLPLGMWTETAASNVDSYLAGEARRARLGEGVEARGYHALLWLHYAYLQLGQMPKARALLDLVVDDAKATDSERTRGHLAFLRAAWAVDSEQWKELPPGPDLEGLSPTAVASDLFATGYAAVKTGDLEAAERALAELSKRYREAAEGEAPTTSAGGYSRFGPVPLVAARVMELELDALIRFARGQAEEALDLLAEATAAEETRPFGFGPPIPAKPSHELYGELLLAAQRPADAQSQFERALERSPRRTKSLYGLLDAARKAGDGDTSSQTLWQLFEIQREAAVEQMKAGVLEAGR